MQSANSKSAWPSKMGKKNLKRKVGKELICNPMKIKSSSLICLVFTSEKTF